MWRSRSVCLKTRVTARTFYYQDSHRVCAPVITPDSSPKQCTVFILLICTVSSCSNNNLQFKKQISQRIFSDSLKLNSPTNKLDPVRTSVQFSLNSRLLYKLQDYLSVMVNKLSATRIILIIQRDSVGKALIQKNIKSENRKTRIKRRRGGRCVLEESLVLCIQRREDDR